MANEERSAEYIPLRFDVAWVIGLVREMIERRPPSHRDLPELWALYDQAVELRARGEECFPDSEAPHWLIDVITGRAP